MATPWVFIESEVLSRVGALRADDEGTGETNYQTIPKTGTEITDAAFNRSTVRTAIVDTAIEVIGAICRTAGDPRRQQYKLTASVAHLGAAPSSIGPYGAIYDASTSRPLVGRSASEISDIRENQAAGKPLEGQVFYFFAIDGSILYHTLAGNVTVEYFDYPRPATTYAALSTMFGSAANAAPIPDEFAAVVADGAAGRLCLKAASMVAEGRAFLEAYYTGLKERGLSGTMPDAPAAPAGN